MNIRKTLALMLAVLFMAGATAFAAGDVCQGCKAPLAYIPKPTGTGQQSCQNSPFDFDGDPDNFPYIDGNSNGTYDATEIGYNTHGTYGYCSSTTAPNTYSYNNGFSPDLNRTQRNPKLLFTICNCTNAASFRPGTWIGVKMTIKTTGVYWATPNDPPDASDDNPAGAGATVQTAINFGRFSTSALACAATDQTNNPLSTSYVAANLPAGNNLYDLGPAVYYTEAAPSVAITAATGLASNVCTIPATQKAKTVQTIKRTATTDNTYGYKVQAEDNGLVYWWIDVPQMIMDSGEAVIGQKVTVNVQLFNNDPQQATICTSCPPLCECDYDLGIIGCQNTAVVAAGSCIYFPYIFTGDADWWTGLAITKLATGDSTLSFEITDSAGSVCKASYTMKEKMYVKVVDDMLTSLSWDKKPAAGSALIKISATTPIDGFQFMSNNSISAAVLARQACGF